MKLAHLLCAHGGGLLSPENDNYFETQNFLDFSTVNTCIIPRAITEQIDHVMI